MLELLRKKAQSPLIQGTILIIALVFIFWGVGSGYRGSRNSVATVNKETIPYEDYQKAYERLSNQYRDQFGGSIPKGLLESLDLEGQTVEQLIQRALLRQGAREMGIRVSNLEVQQAVEKMEAFRSNGSFDVERYKNILSSSRMTPTSFEESMRTDLLAGKVIDSLSRFAKLTSLEVNEQFALENEEIKIEYVPLSASDFKEKVAPDAEKLKSYYEENKENYKTEPQVKLHFLTFPFATGEKPSITEAEAEAFYRDNFSSFVIPEQRRARHILIKTSADDSKDTLKQKRSRAEQILELARSGEDFAELAKQYSEGPTGPRGGDLGTFTRGRLVKPFEDAAFALKEGEISDIVETSFGFHIIKLEKIEPSYTRTFAEAKDEIMARLQAKKSREIAFTKATEAYENIILAGSMDKYSQDSDVAIEETDFFSRKSQDKSGSKVAMAKDPAFLNAAFSLNKGELSSLIETEQGYAIIFAVDKKEPEIAPYEDVAEQVRKDYINAKAEEMAKEAAGSMLSALKEEGSANFASQAAKFNLTPKMSDYITRSGAAGSTLPAEIVNQAFELSVKNPYPDEALVSNGIYYVFKVVEKKSPSPDLFGKKEDILKAGLLDKKKSVILASWLANLRAKADIEINKRFL